MDTIKSTYVHIYIMYTCTQIINGVSLTLVVWIMRDQNDAFAQPIS